MNLYEEKKKLSLDDPRTTELHREIIRNNEFLKNIYTSWYNEFKSYLSSVPSGTILEIGSGGGFCKDIIPEVVTSDIQKLSYVDLHCSAENIPLENESVSAIFMINVLHHIPDSTQFFEEARRVLKPGGVVYMIEPARTPMSVLIYRFLHHEPYLPDAEDWKIKGSGPLSDANIAIPWILFKRDYSKFRKLFPDFALEQYRYHTPYRYLLSGGVSRPSFLPLWMYGLVNFTEKLNSPFARLNAMFTTIVVRKEAKPQ